MRRPRIDDVISIGLRVRGNLLAMLDQFESDERLSGLCAIASIGLMKSLHRHGIRSELVEGCWRKERHVWNVALGHIVDLTLTQFEARAEPVHIDRWPAEDYAVLAIWDSVQRAEDETWVSEVDLDWQKIVAVPTFAASGKPSKIN